jgi:hypothetical protein
MRQGSEKIVLQTAGALGVGTGRLLAAEQPLAVRLDRRPLA